MLVRMVMQSGTIQRPLAVMMQRVVQTISPDATLLDAAQLMREAKVGALLVRDRDKYCGVVSESDLVRKCMAESRLAHDTLVRGVMSQPLISIDIGRSAHDASDLMAEHGIRHLAVTEEGQVTGILSVRDLLRYFKNWGGL
jgi:CBS domain-containing protein